MLPEGERPSKKKSAAIFRSLERGPAYRARSWMWVTAGDDRFAPAAATAAIAAAAATKAVKRSSPRAWGTLRIFHPSTGKRLIQSIER